MMIPRVLIIKHGSIGDIFMSFDAVKAILEDKMKGSFKVYNEV